MELLKINSMMLLKLVVILPKNHKLNQEETGGLFALMDEVG